MRTRRFSIGLLCLLPALVLIAAQPSLAAPKPWVQVRSPHFSVITDAGEDRGRALATQFEQMRAVFGAFMSKPNLSLPAPLQIVAFRNTKEMRRFVPLWRGKPVDMMGYFHQSGDCSVILLDLSAKNYWETAFHEYAHELLNANTSAETQPWFEEGFAEYFSTIQANGTAAQVGAIHKKDLKVVQHKRLMSTADLLGVRQDSPIYNQDGNGRNVFYGQSWLTVHYLFDTDSLGRAFDYFARIAEGTTTTEEAFRQAFGMSTLRFDGVLRDYAKQKAFPTFAVEVFTQTNAAAYSVRVLNQTAAEAELADVHLHSPDYSDVAVREFAGILKRDGGQPVALRGLGYAYLQDRDFARAADLLGKAEQRAPQDPRVQYYLAVLIREEAGPSRPESGQMKGMQARLEKAIEWEPDYAAAYALLSWTDEVQGSQDKSIEAMKRATELNPRSRSYRLDLARLTGAENIAATILKQLEQPRVVSTQAKRQISQTKPVTQSAQAAK